MSPLSTHFLTMLVFIHLPDGYVNLPRLAYPQKKWAAVFRSPSKNNDIFVTSINVSRTGKNDEPLRGRISYAQLFCHHESGSRPFSGNHAIPARIRSRPWKYRA